MRHKKLAILVIAAIILVTLAIRTSNRSGNGRPPQLGNRLLPDLDLNAVARMEIAGPGATLTVARVEAQWKVPSAHNYPADFERVRRALLALPELRIGQVSYLDEAQKRRMKLDPAAVGATNGGTRVVLQAADGKPLATLLLGDSRTRAPDPDSGFGGYPDGRYVSADNGATICLVKESLDDFSPQPRSWINTELLNVRSADLATIRITGPDRPTVALDRPQGGSWQMQGLAETQELDTAKLYSVDAALSWMRFNQVADPALPPAATGLESGTVYEATSYSGMVYRVTLGATDPSGDTYARLAVTTDTARLDTLRAATTNETDAAAVAAVQRDAAALDARFHDWVYLLPSHTVSSLTKGVADLVKEKSQPVAPSAETSADAPAAYATPEQPVPVDAAVPPEVTP